MRNRRYFLPGHVHLITSRIEEGLPFVPLEFMNMLLCSALLRAQRLYPVQLIALTIEANHFHLMMRVIDPEAASAFIGYFKAESAHHLNRLLGRKGKTVWEERFDSPPILDNKQFIEKFAYVILNPVKDGLVASMRDYPGVSSYKCLESGSNEIPVKLIQKGAVFPLKDPIQPFKEDASLVAFFNSDEFKSGTLKFEIECLREVFPELEHLSPTELRELLISSLESAELEYRKRRGTASVIGPYRLTRASMLKPHIPPRNGAKMVCLSSCREIRKEFIKQFRAICSQCREIYVRWKLGYFDDPFPPGMFPPALPRRANLNPAMMM